MRCTRRLVSSETEGVGQHVAASADGGGGWEQERGTFSLLDNVHRSFMCPSVLRPGSTLFSERRSSAASEAFSGTQRKNVHGEHPSQRVNLRPTVPQTLRGAARQTETSLGGLAAIPRFASDPLVRADPPTSQPTSDIRTLYSTPTYLLLIFIRITNCIYSMENENLILLVTFTGLCGDAQPRIRYVPSAHAPRFLRVEPEYGLVWITGCSIARLTSCKYHIWQQPLRTPPAGQ